MTRPTEPTARDTGRFGTYPDLERTRWPWMVYGLLDRAATSTDPLLRMILLNKVVEAHLKIVVSALLPFTVRHWPSVAKQADVRALLGGRLEQPSLSTWLELARTLTARLLQVQLDAPLERLCHSVSKDYCRLLLAQDDGPDLIDVRNLVAHATWGLGPYSQNLQTQVEQRTLQALRSQERWLQGMQFVVRSDGLFLSLHTEVPRPWEAPKDAASATIRKGVYLWTGSSFLPMHPFVIPAVEPSSYDRGDQVRQTRHDAPEAYVRLEKNSVAYESSTAGIVHHTDPHRRDLENFRRFRGFDPKREILGDESVAWPEIAGALVEGLLGDRRAVLVTGAPGTGKTSLLRAVGVHKKLQNPGHWRVVRVRSTKEAPSDLAMRLIEALDGKLAPLTQAEARRALDNVLPAALNALLENDAQPGMVMLIDDLERSHLDADPLLKDVLANRYPRIRWVAAGTLEGLGDLVVEHGECLLRWHGHLGLPQFDASELRASLSLRIPGAAEHLASHDRVSTRADSTAIRENQVIERLHASTRGLPGPVDLLLRACEEKGLNSLGNVPWRTIDEYVDAHPFDAPFQGPEAGRLSRLRFDAIAARRSGKIAAEAAAMAAIKVEIERLRTREKLLRESFNGWSIEDERAFLISSAGGRSEADHMSGLRTQRLLFSGWARERETVDGGSLVRRNNSLLETLERLRVNAAFRCVLWRGQEARLAAVSETTVAWLEGETLQVLDLASGNMPQPLHAANVGVLTVSASALAIQEDGRRLGRWLLPALESHEATSIQKRAWGLALFSPTSTLAAHTCTAVIVIQGPGLMRTLANHSSVIECITGSEEASVLLTGHHDGTVVRWDPTQDRSEELPGRHESCVMHVAISRDGTRAVSIGETSVHLQLLGESTFMALPIPDSASPRRAAIAPGGGHIAVVFEGGVVRVWAVSFGAWVQSVLISTVEVLALGFTSDFEFVTVDAEGIVAAWRLDTPAKSKSSRNPETVP
jgi:hypothetical protein